MKALTLWQPWASAIVLRQKRFETRSWSTRYRGPIAIHAAVRQHDDDRKFFVGALAGLHPIDLEAWTLYCGCNYELLPFGEVIAKCQLIDCLRVEDAKPSEGERLWGNYDAGRFAWILGEIVPLNPPIPATGHQSIWEWNIPNLVPTDTQLSLL